MASAYIFDKVLASGSSASFGMNHSAYPLYTIQIVPTGGASVAVAGTANPAPLNATTQAEDTSLAVYINLPGLGAVTANNLSTFQGPLAGLRVTVSGGGSARVTVLTSNNAL